MVQKNKLDEIFGFFALLSVPTVVVTGLTSIEKKDFRYIAIGVILFGILYFGYITVNSFIKSSRSFRGAPRNFADYCLIIISGIFALSIIIFGISLFLHHYDNDYLINLFYKFALYVDLK